MNREWSKKKIEIIDKKITLILNKVRKKIEGPKRNVLFSLVKVVKKQKINIRSQ